MAQRTCTMPGCGKPYRARGLCSTHYNQANDRRVEIACAECGKATLKEPSRKYANRFCSYACRDEWQYWNTAIFQCSVPDSHPSRSSRVPDSHPSRVPLSCDVPSDHDSRRPRRPAFVAGSCVDCGNAFVVASEHVTVRSMYCSRLCQRRVARRTRRAREFGATGDFTWDEFARLAMSLGNACAYCEGDSNGQPLEPDHVVPISRHGHNGLTNILPACRRCNGDKRNLLVHEWAVDREARGLPPLRYDVGRFVHLTAHSHAA